MSEVVEDIHGFRDRYSKAVERVENSDLAESGKDAILDFSKKQRLRGLAASTYTTDIEILQRSAENCPKRGCDATFWSDGIESVTVEEVEDFLLHLEDEAYSESYVRNFKKVYRKFLNYLGKDGDQIPVGSSPSTQKTPEDVIRPVEARELIDVARNSRDKALIAVIADTCSRIGHVGSLRVRHVEINGTHAKIGVNPDSLSNKTAETARVCTWSTGHLAEWLRDHPDTDNPDAPLWCNLKTVNPNKETGTALNYGSLRKIILRVAERAGLSDAHFHAIRSGTISEWVVDGKPMQEIAHRAHWGKDTRMFKVYGHFTDKEMNDATLRREGLLEDEEDEEDYLTQCPRCKVALPPKAQGCPRCLLVLNQGVAERIDDLTQKMHQEITPQMLAEAIDLVRKRESGEVDLKELA